MRTFGVGLAFACCLCVPTARSAAAQEPVRAGLAERLQDAQLWRQFPVGRAPVDVRSVIEAEDGTPWAISSEEVVWYDGYRWRPVPAPPEMLAGAPRDARPAPGRGILVTIAGRLFRVDRQGAEPIPVSLSGRPAPVTAAAAAATGELLVQLDDEGSPRLLRHTADGFEGVAVPAPLARIANSSLWRTRSGRIWLNTELGLYADGDDGWRSMLPSSGDEAMDVVILRENDTGAGVAYVRNPYGRRGIWTWPRGGTPARVAQVRFDFPRALDITAGGEVIALTDSLELFVIDERGVHRIPTLPAALRSARSLTVGADDRIWTADDRTVHLFRARMPGQWQAWEPAGISGHKRIHDILVRADGSVWLATSDGILIRHDDGRARTINSVAGTMLGTVTGLAEDADGSVWIVSGSGFTGAYRLSGGSWTHFGADRGLADAYFHAVRTDAAGLWFLGLRRRPYVSTTTLEPVGVYRRVDGRFEHWSAATDMAPTPVYDMAVDPVGGRWFATGAGILGWVDGGWRRIDPGVGRSGSRPFSIAASDDGTLFFGDRKVGLGSFRPGEPPSVHGPEAGYPLARVWITRVGRDGTLWAGGQGGLMRVTHGVALLYAQGSGLDNTDVWPIVPLADRVLVGTQGHGLLTLRLDVPMPPPSVRLSADGLPDRRVLLSWDARTWWNSTAADRIEIRYRVDNGPWSRWTRAANAEITDVEHGTRRIDLQARGEMGELAERAATASVRVPAPFLHRPDVRAATLLLMLTLGGLVLRQRQIRSDAARLIGESEARYRAMFEGSADLIFTHDLRGRVTSANRAALETIGYDRSEAIGLPVQKMLTAGALERARALKPAVMAGEQVLFEADLRSRDGSPVPVEMRIQPLREQGRTVAIQGLARDIRDRRRAEETLRNIAMGTSTEIGAGFFESIAESLASELGREYAMVGVLDAPIPPGFQGSIGDRRIRTLAFWSDDGFGESTEYALEGTPCAEVVASDTRVFLDDVQSRFPDDDWLREIGVHSYAGTPLRGADGTTLGLMAVLGRERLENEPLTVAMLRIFANRTAAELERIRAEETLLEREHELRHAHKMEALGRMAGGIAHDFNNLLTVVNGHAQLALEADAPPEIGADLEQILAAGNSAARLTEQLLTFGSVDSESESSCELDARIDELRELLHGLLRDSHELDLDLDAAGESVPASPAQLEQVLLNLVVNAIDAMPENGGLRIATRIDPGVGRVALSVADTGVGMDARTRAAALEPFFTTKAKGSGTGLGLSTVYGVVQGGGGDLRIESAPGRGTIVEISWPRVETSADRRPASEPTTKPSPIGHSTILVVEDQSMVRRLARRTLERRGYTVLEAPDAHAALQSLEQPREAPIELVVSDVIMPGPSGVELAEIIRASNPDIRIVLMSGYNDIVRERNVGSDYDGFLAKPFSPDELAAAVRSALQTPEASRA